MSDSWGSVSSERKLFEREYWNRHLSSGDLSVQDIVNLRNGDSYDDEHIADCWHFFQLGHDNG